LWTSACRCLVADHDPLPREAMAQTWGALTFWTFHSTVSGLLFGERRGRHWRVVNAFEGAVGFEPANVGRAARASTRPRLPVTTSMLAAQKER